MFKVMVNREDIESIREYLDSDECTIVSGMNDYGMDFPAMAFVIDAIITACDDAMEKLNGESETSD